MRSETSNPGRITAIVPTYERPGLLCQCVGSLLAQTRPLAEVLVVDDGSSNDVAAELSGLEGPLRVIRQPNRGKAAAVNLGLGEARGDYVWICDDDDVALPDAAERLAGALDGSPAAFVYGPYLLFRDAPDTGRREVSPPGYWPEPHKAADTFYVLLDDMFMFQFATMVRRSAFEAVGPFREDLVRSVDYEMMLRLARRFVPARIDQPVFLQRQHNSPRGSAADRFEAAQIRAKWVAYDKKIFIELHASLPLESFAPRALAAAPEPVRVRAAYLKRATVMFRRQLWDFAFEDLGQAVMLGLDSRPTAAECAIARAALAGKHGCWDLVTDRDHFARLRATLRLTPYGRRVLPDFARPLRWRTRLALRLRCYAEAAAHAAAYGRLLAPWPSLSAAPLANSKDLADRRRLAQWRTASTISRRNG